MMHQHSSLPMNPTPSAKQSQSKEFMAVQMHTLQQTKLDELATSIQGRSHMQQKLAHVVMVLSIVASLLASLTLLVLFAIAASHCTSTRTPSLRTGEPDAMAHISEAICAMAIDTRYWLLCMLGLNAVAFLAMLPSLTHECCQLSVGVRGWRGPSLCIGSVGHLLSTCMLVGWLYTQGMDPHQLPIVHCATVTLLFSTLIITTAIATTIFIHHDVFASVNGGTNGKISKSRRNSLDLEAARAAIAATMPNSKISHSGKHSPQSSVNQHSTQSSSQRRGRFSTPPSPPPLHVGSVQSGLARGMSLTEIKQIATQVIPCCTPATLLDSATGELLIMPCCEKAPHLPTMVMPLGFTSPRRKDHGPVADLTDTTAPAVATAAAIAASMASPAAQSHLTVPKHLHLNTASPMNGAAGPDSTIVDTRHANTPLAMHAKVGSALHAVLSHTVRWLVTPAASSVVTSSKRINSSRFFRTAGTRRILRVSFPT
jgi:hypothetical protein